jgi:hypothetical protein
MFWAQLGCAFITTDYLVGRGSTSVSLGHVFNLRKGEEKRREEGRREEGRREEGRSL